MGGGGGGGGADVVATRLYVQCVCCAVFPESDTAPAGMPSDLPFPNACQVTDHFYN